MVIEDIKGLKFELQMRDNSKFKVFLEELDTKCKHMVTDNSLSWFKKQLPEKHINKVYNGTYAKGDTSEDNILKSYLETDNENVLTMVYDINAEKITYDGLMPSDEVICIFKLDSLLISKSYIRCVLNIAQIKMCTEPILDTYCIKSEYESCEDVEDNFEFEVESGSCE